MFFDRKSQKTQVLEGRILDDLDGAFDPYVFLYQIEDSKVGLKLPGKELFETFQKKEKELGKKAFEEFVTGKGKRFAEVAYAAKDSENPVLIIYTVKK